MKEWNKQYAPYWKSGKAGKKMKKVVSTLKLNREEWLKYKKQGIGGSDVGAIAGLNPYKTAMEVYQDKISCLQMLTV